MADGTDKEEILFKQYELMVNSTQQVTTWRQTSNGFYITLNTAILAILSGLFEVPDVAHLLLGVAGIAISYFWYMHIDYFSKLNKAKFRVVGEIEEKLPVKAFIDEHKYFKAERCRNATSIEKAIVGIFIILYLLALANSIISLGL
jgi:hypothetical protein